MDSSFERNVRCEFPILSHYVWLMNNGHTPLPMRVSASLRQIETLMCGDVLAGLLELEAKRKAARQCTAKLLNAHSDEIAFFGNVTESINIIAQAIRFDRGDNVVLLRGDFPGLVYPWLPLARKGVEVRFAGRDLNSIRQGSTRAIAEAIDSKTRVVAISHVDWVSGARRNIQEVGQWCKERNIYFVVDATQSLGALRVDVQSTYITALVSRGDKWLVGPGGVACLFVRRELQDELEPGLLGYFGMDVQEEAPAQHDWAYPIVFKPTAERYEMGTPNDLGLVGWAEATSWLLELGVELIEQRVRTLAETAVEGLKQKGYSLFSPSECKSRSGIIAFYVLGYGELQNAMWASNIVTGGDEALSVVRVSPHFFNNESDIGRFLDVLPTL